MCQNGDCGTPLITKIVKLNSETVHIRMFIIWLLDIFLANYDCLVFRLTLLKSILFIWWCQLPFLHRSPTYFLFLRHQMLLFTLLETSQWSTWQVHWFISNAQALVWRGSWQCQPPTLYSVLRRWVTSGPMNSLMGLENWVLL